jgi:Thiamine pyrophosphate-requiring enzymes [acetolactate synthase, pyruvate dehydrogenase (cytochrome), glyoxylate carboligase, phosphonopyruvate decarboxylase]
MKISGAEAVALILKKLGVSNIWGIPGSKTLSVYNAIKDIGIHSVLVTNELSAHSWLMVITGSRESPAFVSPFPAPVLPIC